MAEKDNINEMDIDIDSEKKEVPEVVKEEKKRMKSMMKFCLCATDRRVLQER